MQRGRGAPSQIWLWSGSALFLVLVGITWVTGARVDFDRGRMLQFIGGEELASTPWNELILIHAQPPGFNALLKMADQFGPHNTTVLLALFITLASLGVWMTADVTYQLTGKMTWGIGAGLLAGALPGSTYYTLWVFYTLPVAFLLTSTVWGMVRASQSKSVSALSISVVSIVAAALTRSSVVWVLVGAWLLFNIPTIRQVLRRNSQAKKLAFLSISVVSLGALASLQVNAFASFGSVTLSSWGFENSAKALQTTMTDGEIQSVVENDPCLQLVAEVGVFRPIDEYPLCSRDLDSKTYSDSPLLTKYYWSNGAANMNHVERLELSNQWFLFTSKAIKDDPSRVLRIPFPNLETQERGTMVRFLWPSSWYWLIDKNVSTGGLLASLWILAFAWVPAVMSALILYGLLTSRRLWRFNGSTRQVFRSSATAVVVMTTIYLLLETGENERFRVEIDWLLIALGLSVLGRIWQVKNSQETVVRPSRTAGEKNEAPATDT